MPVSTVLVAWNRRKIRWRAVATISGETVKVHVERFYVELESDTGADEDTGWCPVDEFGDRCEEPYIVAEADVKAGDAETVQAMARAAVQFVAAWEERIGPEEELAAFCQQAARVVQTELDR